MTVNHAGSTLVAVAVMTTAGCGAPTPNRITHYYAPSGYVEMANQLIRKKLVFYDCEHDRILTHPQLAPGTSEHNWYLDSYLKTDIDQFNDSQQRFSDLFLIEGCALVGVNPAAHVVPLPETSGALRQWDGELRYTSRDVVGTLRSNRQTLTILAPSGVLGPSDLSPVPVAPPLAGASASDPIIKLYFDSRAKEAADVHAVGSTAVLRDRRDTVLLSDYDIRVMGRSLPKGRVVALNNRDWVQFVEGSGQQESRTTYQYSLGDQASIISWAGLRNTTLVRATAPSSLGFVGDFLRAMNSSYQAVREEGGRAPADFDVELTLTRALQEETTSALDRFVDRNLPDRTYPRRAAITLMDAFNGETLALASYPSRPELLKPFTYLSSGERRRLLSNQNLNRHPIGSAGKPFLMQAVLHEYPYMSGFTVPGHAGTPKYPTAAGHPLESGYETHNHLTPMGIVRGLAVSCNKLIVDMLTVALGLDPATSRRDRIGRLGEAMRFEATPMPPGDRFSVCGDTANSVPWIRHLSQRSLWSLEQSPIFSRFQKQTGARTHSEPAPEAIAASNPRPGNATFERSYQASRYHVAAWDAVLAKVAPIKNQERRANAIKAIGSASPEAVNLSVNTIDQFRAEWINLLLGGASASWNNVQLAEALSRLVTGRDVRATFSHAGGQPARAAMQTDLDERARSLVLAGLAEVVSASPGSTARQLAGLHARLRAEFPGYDAHVYGKTGTPAVEGLVPRPQMRLIASLFNAGPNGRGGGIYFDQLARRVSLTTSGERILAIANRDLAARVRNIMDDMNGRLAHYEVPAGVPPPPTFPLYLQADQLKLNDRARSAWNSKGALFIATVLMTRAGTTRPGALSACLPVDRGPVGTIPSAISLNPQSVAVTVVAYLEDVPGTSATAVDLVSTLEPQLIAALRGRIALAAK